MSRPEKAFAQELIDFCYDSPTAFHAVASARKKLDQHGFVCLKESDDWKLKRGGRYYFVRNDSALMAFIIGSKPIAETGFKIAGAHTDSPGFRIKPNPEWVSKDHYLRLNTEVYGGPILSTWFDRPLAIAGRVTCKSADLFAPRELLVNINKPLAIIPNMAIHLNPNLNNGYVYDKQIDTLPFVGQVNDKFEGQGYLQGLLAVELGIDFNDILDFDLFLYEYEKGRLIGPDDEYISSGRIDNLQAVLAGITALYQTEAPETTCVVACFDNEEVGSSTRQGADSTMLAELLERITLNVGENRKDFLRALSSSFILSVDGAHACHPNLKEKEDPTNRPTVNSGPAIKQSASKSYTSDSLTSAIFRQICERAGIPSQCFVNRSSMRGGSTIGPISATHVSIPSVDIGVPMLAMHSIRELCGIKDNYYMLRAIASFFAEN